MDYLTVKEVAELKGCSIQYIQKLVKNKKLEAIQELNPDNNCMQYKIPVSALPEPLQMKYYGKLTSEAQLCLPKVQETAVPQKTKRNKAVVKKEFGEFNAEERELITFWTDLLREWQIRRREYDNCAEGDMVFIAETKRLRRAYLAEHNISISRDILYRKFLLRLLIVRCMTRGERLRSNTQSLYITFKILLYRYQPFACPFLFLTFFLYTHTYIVQTHQLDGRMDGIKLCKHTKAKKRLDKKDGKEYTNKADSRRGKLWKGRQELQKSKGVKNF